MKRTIVTGTALFLALSLNITAATFGPGFMAVPFDGAASNIFGFAVAASGNTLAVAAPLNITTGAVYLYQRSGDAWIQQTKLVSSDGTILGTSLAIDGSTLISSGHVFVNNNGVWSEQARLPGGNVAISRDTIAVAASNTVQVFVRNNSIWTLQAAIPISVSSAIVTVALENDTLLVGAPNATTAAGFAAGMAFVFGRQNGVWTQQAALTASDAQPASLFGLGVSINGGTMAVGAPGAGPFQDRPGSAYIYINNNGTWTQQAEASGTEAGSFFGTGLTLVGNTLLVGAYDEGDFGTAHVFIRNGVTWTDQYLLAPGINGVPGPGSPEQRFANSVAMDGSNTFILGSPTFSGAGLFKEGAFYSSTLH